MKMQKKTLIVVAGGYGVRVGSNTPKQFLLVGGMPVLMHTLERFYSYDDSIRILLVIPERYNPIWKELCNEYFFSVPHELIPGGTERFHSVKKALESCSDEGLIAVHDGVRPLVSVRTIAACFAAAAEYGSGVPAMSPAESIRILQNGSSRPIDRAQIKIVQTPQVFRADYLQKAYQADYQDNFTDDASVFEAAGFPIHLCEGNPENIKITHAIDLELAASLLNSLEINQINSLS